MKQTIENNIFNIKKNIKFKLFIPFFIVLFISFTFYIISIIYINVAQKEKELSFYKENKLQSQKNELKEKLDMVCGILEIYKEKIEKKEILESVAKETVIKIIKNLKYEKYGYFWIITTDYILIASKAIPLEENTYIKDLVDIKGNKFIEKLVDGAIKNGEVYEKYYYPKIGKKEHEEKLTYAKFFKEWGWIIGTGTYFDKFNMEIKSEEKLHKKHFYEELLFIILGCTVILCIIIILVIFLPKYFFRYIEKYIGIQQSIIDNIPFIIWVKDEKGVYLSVNNEFCKYHKVSTQEVIRKNDFEVFATDKEKANHYVSDDMKVIKTGNKKTLEKLTTKNNKEEWYETFKSPIFDKNNKIIGTLGYVRDITELKTYEERLKKEKMSAEEANKLKSQFLANMSHEIRTPMNAIVGFTDILLTIKINNEQKEYLQMIRNSSSYLLDIINDILDYSKIEAGKIVIEQTNFSLYNLIESIIKTLSLQALKKSLTLSYEIDKNIPDSIIGDPIRLRQILINLCGNAIKFTEDGSVKINCYLSEKDDEKIILKFAISDTGIGISKEKQSKLFNVFTQADISTTRKYGGTGLGLVISKSLVELMQGKIWFESKDNQGTTFYFTISLKIGKKMRELDNIEELEEVKEVKAINKSPAKEKYIILLVEDNEVNQKLAFFLLTKLGYQVDIANNGIEALKKIEEKEYSIILMDMLMPEMDGIEASKKIREKEKLTNKHIPIIALTANAFAEDKEKCIEAGMDDFISKPIKKEELHEKLKIYTTHNPN